MGTAHSLEQHAPPLVASHDNEHVDVQAVLEENHQLRELVIQLSKLVIRNVVDRSD